MTSTALDPNLAEQAELLAAFYRQAWDPAIAEDDQELRPEDHVTLRGEAWRLYPALLCLLCCQGAAGLDGVVSLEGGGVDGLAAAPQVHLRPRPKRPLATLA